MGKIKDMFNGSIKKETKSQLVEVIVFLIAAYIIEILNFSLIRIILIFLGIYLIYLFFFGGVSTWMKKKTQEKK